MTDKRCSRKFPERENHSACAMMSSLLTGNNRGRDEALGKYHSLERSTLMPWTKLDSRDVYENPWIAVREDRVINPGGGENQYGVVHFKNIAVAIVPLDNEGNTWLVGQNRYPLGQYSWEIPMGGAPRTEQAIEAARRELKEETGLTADSWTELMRLHTSNSITDEEGVVYIATELGEGDTDFDETEDIEVRKLPLGDAIAMAMRGEITDAISVAALLRLSVEFKWRAPDP
jgi:8-oxo-dGTP pyrophosphatase MutT (NUDIX family)